MFWRPSSGADARVGLEGIRLRHRLLTLGRFPMSRVNEPRASEPGPYVFRGVVEAAIATAPVARAAATL
jgi:hypothetical protein